MTGDTRVVVTGMGPVAPNGIGISAFWGALVEGRSAVGAVEGIDVSRHNRKVGGEVHGFDPRAFMSEAVAEGAGRTSQLAIAAGKLALHDAGLDVPPGGVFLVIGSTLADMTEVEKLDDEWLENGEASIDPSRFARHNPAAFAVRISRGLGLVNARAVSVHAACSSSNQAIALGAEALRNGEATIAIVGGSDAFSRLTFSGFARLGAMAPDRCSPFDKHRRGMLVSEGAGMIVLETLASARARGARIYGEVAGYGLSCDAHHLASPPHDGGGLAGAIAEALRRARIDRSEVDFIGAHGTGTVANDRAETRALYSVFGDRARRVPVNSIKSMIGHTMGAANVLQAIAGLMSMQESVITPTINYETPDPNCELDCVPNEAREAPASTTLVNGAGFGGNNACVVLRSVE